MFHVEHFVHRFADKFSVLQKLEEEYFKWNNKINISAIRDTQGFWEKHILDSICLLEYLKTNFDIINNSSAPIYDIGSGGGFPGVVLAIFLKNPIILVDPVNKKGDYLEHVSRKLGLPNIKVERAKYQDIEIKDNSIIVSRALGRYEELFEHMQSKNLKFNMIIMTTNKTIPQLEGETVDYHYNNLGKDGVESLTGHILFHVKQQENVDK